MRGGEGRGIGECFNKVCEGREGRGVGECFNKVGGEGEQSALAVG